RRAHGERRRRQPGRDPFAHPRSLRRAPRGPSDGHPLPRGRTAVRPPGAAQRLQPRGERRMNLFAIALKSIRQRALASALTSLSVALGVMLMVTVIVINGIVGDVFSQRAIGYDLIVGPKGSDMQLVLSTVFRVAPAIETLPYQYYLDLQKD